jgi:anthranilate synthase component 1
MPVHAVPHIREFLADSLTPLEAYRRLGADSPYRFLFESVSGGDQVARYSFLGAEPREIYRVFLDRIEVERDGEASLLEGPPLSGLREIFGGIEADTQLIPFTGGFVGFFGYDFVRTIEVLKDSPPDAFGLPISILARYDNLVVFDHARQRILAIANEIEGMVSPSEAENYLERISERLTQEGEGGAVRYPSGAAGSEEEVKAISLTSARDFRDAVEKAKKYIAAGDIFQVVLARRWRIEESIEPVSLFRALRMVNPSPYMVLLESPEVALIGASPEMLVRKVGSRVEIRPIAGTRPRGHDAQEDRRLAAELLSDPKERAEHVMLVDLGRNDVGRIAQAGTVRVPEFMEIEHYSHVMHIVSSVEGEIASGGSGLDALISCFPAGTVSGAPKIRAMEIIDELESESRGPYAGAVGYLSFSGDLDTCIAIRTLMIRNDEISVMAGAGVVADSDPEMEQKETENKAAGLIAAVNLARRIQLDLDDR